MSRLSKRCGIFSARHSTGAASIPACRSGSSRLYRIRSNRAFLENTLFKSERSCKLFENRCAFRVSATVDLCLTARIESFANAPRITPVFTEAYSLRTHSPPFRPRFSRPASLGRPSSRFPFPSWTMPRSRPQPPQPPARSLPASQPSAGTR